MYFKIFLKDYLYVFVRRLHMSTVACENLKRVSGLLELGYQAIMNGLTWVFGS